MPRDHFKTSSRSQKDNCGQALRSYPEFGYGLTYCGPEMFDKLLVVCLNHQLTVLVLFFGVYPMALLDVIDVSIQLILDDLTASGLALMTAR